VHVPLLQGSNLDEGEFFVGIEFDLLAGHPLTAAQYRQVVTGQFGAQREGGPRPLPAGEVLVRRGRRGRLSAR
jgi:hypothetical protein